MTHTSTEKWVRVTRAVPCPICGKRTYCGFTPDMAQVRCMRVPSDRPVEDKQGGTGWMHRLTDPIPIVPPKPKPRKWVQFSSYFEHHHLATTPAHIEFYAAGLGLTPASGRRLGMVWDIEKHCAVFPMWVGGEVVGGRCRTVQGGIKFSLTGTSNDGAFIPDGGLVPDMVEQVYVVEGPTDCWAALDMGLYAVGRSFSHGSAAEVVRISRGRDVVILPDQDPPKVMPNGLARCVGMDGAERLATALKGQARSVKVVPSLLGFKDLRQLVNSGGTADDLSVLVHATGVRK